MVLVRLVSDERPELVHELRVLSSWAERLRGLIGAPEDAGAVLLARCGSIHTFGMGYAIDAAFVGERGEVLKVERGLEPRQFAAHPEACCVMERPSRDGPWVEEGEHLWACSLSADAVGR